MDQAFLNLHQINSTHELKSLRKENINITLDIQMGKAVEVLSMQTKTKCTVIKTKQTILPQPADLPISAWTASVLFSALTALRVSDLSLDQKSYTPILPRITRQNCHQDIL